MMGDITSSSTEEPSHQVTSPLVRNVQKMAYNPFEIVDLMATMYKLLARMHYIKESDIHYAPHDPPINVEMAESLGWEPQVIKIMQQLPYVTADNSKSFFRYGGFADYRGQHGLEMSRDPLYCSPDFGKGWDEEGGPYVRPWVLPLNSIGSRGSVIFFDTRTGKYFLSNI